MRKDDSGHVVFWLTKYGVQNCLLEVSSFLIARGKDGCSPFSVVTSRIDITFGRFLHHSGKSSARGRSNRWESFSFRLSGREVKLDFMFSQYEFLLNCGYFDIPELKIETS